MSTLSHAVVCVKCLLARLFPAKCEWLSCSCHAHDLQNGRIGDDISAVNPLIGLRDRDRFALKVEICRCERQELALTDASPVEHFKGIEGNGLVHDRKGKLLIFLLRPEEHFPASGLTHVADLCRRILMQPVILHRMIENGAELIVERFQIDRRIRISVSCKVRT